MSVRRTIGVDRRRLLGTGAGAALAVLLTGSGRAFATLDEVERAIAAFGGGAASADGPLTLTLPEVAEDGNGVPVSISVESPMTAADHVRAVALFATDNPHPEVATFRFTPASGRAAVTTRMRLARTQSVVAVARTSTGAVFIARRDVQVMIGGCGA